MRGAFLVGVAVLAVAAGGCRSGARGNGGACAPEPTPAACTTPDMPTVTRVLVGDTLHGRLACDQGCQCFYFEGVAYTAFDWSFSADGACAVDLAITDPDGQPVPLPNARKGKGYILRKTGLYRGTVCKAAGSESMYAFSYDLRALPPEAEKVWLTPETRKELTVHVPRGSNVLVTIQPTHDCNVVPMVYKVKGPDGKSALGPEVLDGACPALVLDGRSNARRLRFNAAQPGRYVVTISSEPGTEGEAEISTQVFQPKPANRDLYHDNAPCPESCGPTQVADSGR